MPDKLDPSALAELENLIGLGGDLQELEDSCEAQCVHHLEQSLMHIELANKYKAMVLKIRGLLKPPLEEDNDGSDEEEGSYSS